MDRKGSYGTWGQGTSRRGVPTHLGRQIEFHSFLGLVGLRHNSPLQSLFVQTMPRAVKQWRVPFVRLDAEPQGANRLRGQAWNFQYPRIYVRVDGKLPIYGDV
jgi:hypothetical protein